MKSRIEKFERIFAQNQYDGPSEADGGSENSYLIRTGALPVLLSAPHAVNHPRHGEVKPADLYTGSIAMFVQELTGCHVICSTRSESEDPNYTIAGAYKEAVAELARAHGIRFVIDLHGAAESHDFDVDLGTMGGASGLAPCVSEIRRLFAEHGLARVTENKAFPARHPGTVTAYATSELGLAALQAEINRKYRDPGDPDALEKLVVSLEQLVYALGSTCQTGASRGFEAMSAVTYAAREEVLLHPQDLAELGLLPHLRVKATAMNGRETECYVACDRSVRRGRIKLSKRCRDKLGLGEDTPSEAGLALPGDGQTVLAAIASNARAGGNRVTLERPAYESVRRGIPLVDEIAKTHVRACKELEAKYGRDVEIMNPVNGYRVHVRLKGADTAKPSSVYLDRYNLLLLGVEPGDTKGKLILSAAKRKTALGVRLRGWLRSAVSWPGDFLIGQREITLRVGYLFPFDERHRLVRVHPNVRRFLGVEENDRLSVSYGGRTIVLPVLDVDTEHMDRVARIDDAFVDSHLYIGIPALDRNRLGIPNIGTAIRVRRNRTALLYKHLNKLILPVIALWFTLAQMYQQFGWKVWHLVLASVVLLPVILYTSLSEERAKIK